MKKGLKIFALLLTASAITFVSCKKDEEAATETTTIKLTPTDDATIFQAINAPDQIDTINASGTGDFLRVGNSYNGQGSFGDFRARTLIKFNVSSIPSNATITDVSLNFTVARQGYNVPVVGVGMYKLNSAWVEGTTEDSLGCYGAGYAECVEPGDSAIGGGSTWIYSDYNTTMWTTPGGDFNSSPSDSTKSPESTTSSFNGVGLVNDIQSWVDGSATNNGWLIKLLNEDSGNGEGEFLRVYSGEGGGGIGAKPRLLITYEAPVEE